MIGGFRVRDERSDPEPGPVRRGSRGQATVESALLIPFVAVLLLALIQIGLLVHARVMVTHAAREGVRVAAVGGSDDEVREAVAVAGDLVLHRLRVEITRESGTATVEVSYVDPTSIPLVGSMIHDVELVARARMRIE